MSMNWISLWDIKRARDDNDKPRQGYESPSRVTIRYREPFPAFPNLSAKLHLEVLPALQRSTTSTEELNC